MDPENAKAARSSAVAMLARRAATRRQVVDRLVRRGYARDTAESVTQDLVARGYIDDEAFATSWAAAARRRGCGRAAIVEGLSALGFTRSAALAVAEATVPPEDDLPLAQQAAERWAAGKDLPMDGQGAQKAAARLFAYLLRRGFPAGVSRKVAMLTVTRRAGEDSVQLDNNF